MSVDYAKTKFLSEDAFEERLKKKVIAGLPIPASVLYKQILISLELGEEVSFFDALRFITVLLKFLASVCLADYLKLLAAVKISSREVNKAAMDYFKTGGGEEARKLVKLAVTHFTRNNFSPTLKRLSELLMPYPADKRLPRIVDPKVTVIDSFGYFFQFEEELISGKYSIKPPPEPAVQEYVKLAQYLVQRLVPLLEFPFIIPARGKHYNSFNARGIGFRPHSTKFDGEKEFVEKYKNLAILYRNDNNFLNLYPFIYVKMTGPEDDPVPDRILFLHRAGNDDYRYIDYYDSREYPVEELHPGLVPFINNALNKFQADGPREKKEISSPIASFEDLIDRRREYFIPREPSSGELESLIKKNERKYILVTGDSGRGKTTILCSLLFNRKKRPSIYHFVRRVMDQDRPVIILRSLIGQLLRIRGRLEMEWGDIPHDLPGLKTMFQEKLEETASFFKRNNEKLLLVIDAVDEIVDQGSPGEILPEKLPPNVVAVISAEKGNEGETTGKKYLPHGIKLIKPQSCPLQPFTPEETARYMEKFGLAFRDEKSRSRLAGKVFLASRGGEPILEQLICVSLLSGRIDLEDLEGVEEKSAAGKVGMEGLVADDYYRIKILNPLYTPVMPGEKADSKIAWDILGILCLINHPLTAEDLARTLHTEISRILPEIRLLDKYLIREEYGYSFSHRHFKKLFLSFFLERDLVSFHRKIIDFYQVKKPDNGGEVLDGKALSLAALRYLPYHYFRLGQLTGDFSGLYELVSNDSFRLEQGLRLHVSVILESLHLAIQAAVRQDNIKALIKFGFLHDDIRSGGIKGGLSMIITQAVEGNFNEALDMVRKIPDGTFKYRQFLFLVWLSARNNDFLNAMEVLDEALMIPGAEFSEAEEGFILPLVEGAVGYGVAEALDVLSTGISENRVVEYYSRLAELLSEHQELIGEIATGATMQLRKFSDEKLKSRYILEFARIIARLKDEIKKRQFFENFIYEAKGLEDERIRYETLSDLAQIFADVDKARAEDILKEILTELEDLGDYSPVRFSLEARVAGIVARRGREEWATEIFAGIIEKASQLMIPGEKADVLQDIARATVFLQDSGNRADLLEKVFSIAESLDDINLQARVMVGISEVLTGNDEELLNIYLETFKYIDELPVDIAAKAVERIAGNLKIVRELEWYEQIMTVVANLSEYLKTPEEKASTLTPVGIGLCKVKNMPPQVHFEYVQGLIDLLVNTWGFEDKTLLGDSLGKIASSVIQEEVPGGEELIGKILQTLKAPEYEGAASPVYHCLGENIHLVKKPEDIARLYEQLESLILELKTPRARAEALTGVIKGIIKIENRAVRDRLIDKVTYLVENLEEKKKAYHLLSLLSTGLIKTGSADRGIDLYKKALSLIPLKEEKAPDALGGVMAGLCRGVARFASLGWAREIYDRLLNRLDFIAPEKKKLEVFGGIIDGLEALEDKKLLSDYYSKLIPLVERFSNRREKVMGFLRLARAFQEIGENEQARKMWEQTITVALYMVDEINGELKADILSQTLLSIWNLENKEWMDQACGMVVEGIGKLPPCLLNRLMEKTFHNLEQLAYPEIQAKILEELAKIIDGLENDDDRIECLSAVSRGIMNMTRGPLLRQVLDRIRKDVNKVKEGTYRARAMAILASNFLNVGEKKWARQAYTSIHKAYQGLNDPMVKSVLLGELARIPFASEENDWQDETARLVLNNELKFYKGDDKTHILVTMAEIIPHSHNRDWTKKQFDQILKETAALDEKSGKEIIRSMFKGLAETGDIESILEYRSLSPIENIKEISGNFLQEAMEQAARSDVKASLDFFERIDDREIKLHLLRKLFNQLMENREQLPGGDFQKYYNSMLELSIYDRDSLDYAIGKVVSYFSEQKPLIEIAELLGLAEKRKLEAPAAPKAVAPGEAPVPSKEAGELDEPLELLAEPEPVSEEAEEARKSPRRRFGLLHRKTRIPVETKTEVVKEKKEETERKVDITDFLKDGYRLVKSQYFTEAMRYFEKAMEAFPGDSRGYIGMAATNYMLRDYRASARYYAQACEAEPDADNMESFLKGIPKNAYIWYDFTKNLYEIGEYREAARLCDRIKSEGVYFDFVKKVDDLKKKCLDATTRRAEKSGRKINPLLVAGIAAALFLILSFTSILSWLNYNSGNGNMKSARDIIFGYAEGTISGNKSEYDNYSFHFKKAIEDFEKAKQALLFPRDMVQKARLNKAICKYEIAHFPILSSRWKLSREPELVEVKEALKLRQQGIDELEKLVSEEGINVQARYYLGMSYLDFATDPSYVQNISRVNREEAFRKAVKNLEESIQYSSGKADYRNYLMAAEARLEASLAFRDAASSDWLDKAENELSKAQSLSQDKDPRIPVYFIAVYKLNRDSIKAGEYIHKARKAVKEGYEDVPRKRDFWLHKIIKFSEIK